MRASTCGINCARQTSRSHAPQANERQGEAVGFTADGSGYVTVSEGEHAPIHAFATR